MSNHQKSTGYQNQLRGWNQFFNLRGCKHKSQQPHHLQYISLPHPLAWILYHWLKKLQHIRRYPRFSKPGKHKHRPDKFNTNYASPPHNFGTNFRTQSEQNLVANHLFELPPVFRIYNNQGEKETIDTLLMGGDRNTWWEAVGNELGRLANGIDNRVRATNMI